MSKTIEQILTPKPIIRPRIYAYSIADVAHAGQLKVGQTTRDVKQRVAEQLKTANIVSERLKGASARRFKRGQFDRKGMVHSDSGFLRKPSTGVGTWYVVWIWTKLRELSSYSLQG